MNKGLNKGLFIALIAYQGCVSPGNSPRENNVTDTIPDGSVLMIDTASIAADSAADLIRYGKALMLSTARYIGPEGSNGRYTRSYMNCTNCHQNAGTKQYSFDLLAANSRYPQYRAREGRILSLAERVNNCMMRPLNGDSLSHDTKEMKALLAYLKWLDKQVPEDKKKEAGQSINISFMNRPADPDRGAAIYSSRCARCHGTNGEGMLVPGATSYTYPRLWGDSSYQPGSSMHRVIKLARWLKANMPQDSAKWYKPVLTDDECLDVSAFVNDDRIHKRPSPASFDYPHPDKKPIDYGRGPFVDTFSALQHKFGPYQPIIDYWKAKGLKPSY
ncbi:MAG TPA: c-type cytochrome [Chitinophagaceae bacterium]|jgi:thiosulfate dehydrogenase|nr:c-type cytochrome [Chitinophagaceae bacterium]